MSWIETEVVGFAPDLPYDTPGIITAGTNVIPTRRGFSAGIYPALMAATALDADSTGVATVNKIDGTERMFIGTSAKLWEYNGTTTNTDRSGTAYSASNTQPWTFCQVGDVTLAANKGDFLQSISGGGAFAAVGAAPVPKTAIIMNVGLPSSYFVMALNYNDGTNNYVDGWFCSALGDYTNWTTSIATQCANGRLIEPTGAFTAGVPFRDGCLAFKANAMYRGTYSLDTAAGIVWAWERIAGNIGCAGPGYACVVDDVAYFADRRGIWMYDGSYPKRLPGAVHGFWANAISSAVAIPSLGQMKYDPIANNIYLSYVSTTGAVLMTFNLMSQRWGPSSLVDVVANSKYLRHIIKTPTATTGFATVASNTANPVASIALNSTSTYPLNVACSFGAVGSVNEYVQVDRFAPIWIGLNQPSATSNIDVLTANGMPTASKSTLVSNLTIDSTQRWFDFNAEANFVYVALSCPTAFEFSRIAFSAAKAGAAGKK